MLLDMAEDITEELMKEFDNRSLFNGIDEDIINEIREAIFDIVSKGIL